MVTQNELASAIKTVAGLRSGFIQKHLPLDKAVANTLWVFSHWADLIAAGPFGRSPKAPYIFWKVMGKLEEVSPETVAELLTNREKVAILHASRKWASDAWRNIHLDESTKTSIEKSVDIG